MALAVVILAAGQGTRMKSSLPKVLHRAAGRSMLEHVLRAAKHLEPERIVIVTGHGADAVEAAFRDGGVVFARQTEQLGTAHAFRMAIPHLQGFNGEVLVLYGDTPMLKAETLNATLEHHRSQGAGMTVLTCEVDNPTGYGRIIRGDGGEVLRIVEEKAANAAVRAVKEINSGVYAFSQKALDLVGQIGNSNPAGEYYLTDILELYRQAGDKAFAHKHADATELEGVNDRVQLALADRVLRDRVRDRLMRSGVTLQDPDAIYVDDGVKVGQDVILSPGVFLEGDTTVGAGSRIGPHSRIVNSTLEANVVIHGWTVIQDSYVSGGSDIGPFARFRPGVKLEADAHVGNFVELKNTTLGRGSKAGHLAYLGDASIGEEVNIGAGTITANYDGLGKYRTEIGSGTFIGSNTVIVAPRVIGEAAYIAAGSSIHQDVPAGGLSIARGKQRDIPRWSIRFWTEGLKHLKPEKFPFLRRWLSAQGTTNEGNASE